MNVLMCSNCSSPPRSQSRAAWVDSTPSMREGGRGTKRAKEGERKKERQKDSKKETEAAEVALAARSSGYHRRRAAAVRLNELQECGDEKDRRKCRLSSSEYCTYISLTQAIVNMHSDHRCFNNSPALHKQERGRHSITAITCRPSAKATEADVRRCNISCLSSTPFGFSRTPQWLSRCATQSERDRSSVWSAGRNIDSNAIMQLLAVGRRRPSVSNNRCWSVGRTGWWMAFR